MDFTSRPLLAGAGGLIVGAVIGLGLGSSGRSEAEAEVAAQRAIAANVGTLSQTVEGVDARIAALEARLGAVEGSVSALDQTQTGRLEALGAQLQGFGAEIGGQVTSFGGGLADTLTERLETLKTELAAMGTRLQAPEAEEAPATEPEEKAAPAAAAAPTGEPSAGELVLIGSAASFGDALSVFLSGVNAEAGTARVAVNGPVTSVLTLGEATPAGDCTLTLTGFGEGGAYLDGVCGDGGAAAPAAGQQEGSAEPVTGGEAVRMGAAGSFGEGKVRIFLSGVNNEAQTARIALNGLRTAEMRLQEKVDAAGCAVTLTGIDAEGATFKVDC